MPEKSVDYDFDEGGIFSVGMHPWYLTSAKNVSLNLAVMKNLISQPEFVAIGEAGLDKVCQTSWDLQESSFKKQVTLAEQSKKTMIIHCVKAYNEILVLRKEMKASQPWIFHGFNSSMEIARQIIEAGCLLSFGQIIFKPKTKALKAFLNLQPGQYFLETDNNDLTIEEVYRKAADLKNISLETLIDQQIHNFKTLFRGIPVPL